MSRWLAVAISCGLLGMCPGTARAQAGSLPAKLMAPIDFQGFDDIKTILQQGLEHLSKRYRITFQVNEKAFRSEQVADVIHCLVAKPNLPPMPGSRLKNVLQAILDRVPATSGATFLIRDGYIEITTTEAARAEIWGETFKGPFFPLVHPRGQDRPLAELFDEVAAQGPVNVAIDPRVREKLTLKVTTRLVNVPADTALTLLSEMAGVRTVRLHNVFYITTPERAAELRQQQERKPARPGKMGADRG